MCGIWRFTPSPLSPFPFPCFILVFELGDFILIFEFYKGFCVVLASGILNGFELEFQENSQGGCLFNAAA